MLAKYASATGRVRARCFTDGEHRTKKSERSVAGIGQPNPSCKSSFRRNCCAVPLTASERYMQSSARSVHAKTRNGTSSAGSSVMHMPMPNPTILLARLAPHHHFAQ